MAKRKKYDFELLQNYCNENNVVLLEDYSCKYITRDNIIKGKCIYENCNNEFEKNFRELINAGGYCKLCIQIVRNNKRKIFNLNKYANEEPTKIYDFGKLENICKEKNITLLKNYKNEQIFGETIIEGLCIYNCGQIFKRTLKDIIKNKNLSCTTCKQIDALLKRKNTCIHKYGVEFITQCNNIQEKIKVSNLIKYGVEYTTQLESNKEKFKQTCIEKYGYKNPSQNEEIKNKKTNTCLKNWGVKNPLQNEEIKNKIKKNCLIKWGTEYSLQNEEIKNKIKVTNFKKYGCNHPTQNSEIMEKSVKTSFTKKEYVFPSGRIDKIQGYENYALDELIINEKIDESDIITGCKNVPTIWYNDENGKKHRHYVDIFIPSQNKCIEVKSSWTAKQNEHNIFLKQKAAKELGYKYAIWVYNNKKENVKCYY